MEMEICMHRLPWGRRELCEDVVMKNSRELRRKDKENKERKKPKSAYNLLWAKLCFPPKFIY